MPFKISSSYFKIVQQLNYLHTIIKFSLWTAFSLLKEVLFWQALQVYLADATFIMPSIWWFVNVPIFGCKQCLSFMKSGLTN